MKIDLVKFNDRRYIDEDFEIDLNMYQNKDIVDLKDLHVKGYISYNIHDELEVNLNVTGVMYLIDAVTLEVIEYPLNIKIEDEIATNTEYFKDIYEKEQNILDIKAILWENIVLEVPIRITNTEDVVLKGEGWSMGKEKEEDNIDPRLAKLKELLED